MSRIKSIKKQTSNRFLNLYELEAERRNGNISPYYLASRSSSCEQLKISTNQNKPDGVIIYSIYGEKKDRVVLIKQYRYPIGNYVYEFPAGLVEENEDIIEGAVRELYEETGLHLTPIKLSNGYDRPFFTTVGMTDESCGTVYGYCHGIPTNKNQEDSEDIEIVLADKEECKRILKEENVAIMCAYMLMHFIHSKEEPFYFLKEEN